MADNSPANTADIADKTDSPDVAGETAAPENQADTQAAKQPGAFRRTWNSTKRKAAITWAFTKELFNDHTFWVKALAVKGGASAIIVTGLVGISAVMSMPLLVAATGITLSVGLIGLGVYGMAAGGIKAWEGLQDVYARTMGRAPKEHVYKERKDMLQRLGETKFFQNMKHHRIARKISHSHAWRTTMKFTRNREDSVLGGIAVGGAALSLVAGAVALPFVAVGSLLTVATVFTVSSVISGVSGLYFSITGLREESRLKREHAAKQKAAKNAPKMDATDLAPIGAPFVDPPALPLNKLLSEPFSHAAQTAVETILPPPANTNIQPPVAKTPAIPAA